MYGVNFAGTGRGAWVYGGESAVLIGFKIR